ncbi:CPK3 [Symbiodinium pilosum]|uniref:CPK3 protein n=1 Tax=Symbiodinium pilosum TaxID=2952 RepID=A0A812LV57_SYMPI|nr:CPK3 [Symbiodinium pilosum]
MGGPATSLPEWLKDMGKGDPKSIRPVPPGIDPSRFKIIRMEGVQIRALIGKGGETIKEIRLRSGADIKIDHLPSDPEGNVTIVGDVEKTEGMIKDTLASKGCPLGVPHAKLAAPPAPPGLDYGTNPPGLGMGGPMMGGPMQTPGYECAENEVVVPADLVAGLIGPSGSGVKEIRERSGGQVFISILPPSHAGADQLVRVVGDNHLLAKQLILEKIEELKLQYRGPGGCSPMPGYAGMGMQSSMLGSSYPSRPKAPGVGILGAAHAPPMPMSPFLQNQAQRIPPPALPPPPGPMRGMGPPPALPPPIGPCGGCGGCTGPCAPPAPRPPPGGGFPRLGGPPAHGGFPGGPPGEMMRPGPGPVLGGCGLPPMSSHAAPGQGLGGSDLGPSAHPPSFAPPSASPQPTLPPAPAPPAKASTDSTRDFNAMLREAAKAAEATIGMSQPPKPSTPQAGVPLL